MRLATLRNGVHWAAIAGALFVGLCLPLGYFWVAHSNKVEQTQFKARLGAARLAKYIYAHEKLWQYQKVRLSEIAEADSFTNTLSQTVRDDTGRMVLATGTEPATPVVRQTAPIIVGGRQVGELEVAISLRPTLWRVSLLSLISLLLASAVYAAVRLLPLRALDETLNALEASHVRLSRANLELTAQAEKLSEAQEIGKFGYWHYKLGSKEIWWSPEIYKLLKHDPEKLKPTSEIVMTALRGSDARLVREAQARCTRNKSVETVDVKIVKGDGSSSDFSITSKVVLDADGKVVGMTGTIQDITARKSAEEQLERLAYYDPLTGLANRALFSEALKSTLKAAHTQDGTSALLLIDLDRFKDVNDTLGHSAGDQLLVEVANRIKNVLHRDDFVARLGGDEFAVILRGLSSRNAIEGMALRIICALEGEIKLERGVVSAGASIGIALIAIDGHSNSDLLRNADLALYRAKDDGRGLVRFFTSDMNEEMQSKSALARDLRHAVETGEGLELHYQPQIDLRRGSVMGFEALVRWTHPVRGPVPPSEFIPLAESSRLICELGSWVLRRAVAQTKAWIDAGELPRQIAVNISAAQIWNSNLVEEVDRALTEADLAPNLLCIELTESLMAEQGDARVAEVLKSLKARGISLALDDFGTGYSSLGYLAELPFDKLKIDRVFVTQMGGSDHARELLRGIITLGHGLRLKVQAEGAETLDDVRRLVEFGADFVQGFAFSRAVPAADAIAFARTFESDTTGGVLKLLSVLKDAHKKIA